jgi:uncharacterized membrane protein
MKPQDIAFIISLAILLFFRKPIFFVVAGLICFVLAMPLFAFWVFFTAERLVWYGASFIFLGILLMLFKKQ